jgi:hypothetical protein
MNPKYFGFKIVLQSVLVQETGTVVSSEEGAVIQKYNVTVKQI